MRIQGILARVGDYLTRYRSASAAVWAWRNGYEPHPVHLRRLGIEPKTRLYLVRD